MRSFVRASLEEELGAEVFEAESGLYALQRLPRESFDLVIVDVNMPDLNGLELVSFMRRQPGHQGTPILMISTEAAARDREKGMALGANAFLSKPFTPDELCSSVRALIEKPSPQDTEGDEDG